MLRSIQTCRALAALLVVFFHTAGNLAKAKYFGDQAAALEKIFWFGGEAGVAFFFVLSGFIIHHVHRQDFDRPERLIPYLRKRLTRIYPIYLIVFLAVYLFAISNPSMKAANSLDTSVLLKSLLLIPQDGRIVGGTGAPVLIVAWSLQYEMLFYAAFATAIVRRWLMLVLMIAFLAIYLLQLFRAPHDFPLSFFSSHLVLLFAMGMAASAFVRSGYRLTAVRTVIAASSTAFLSVALVSDIVRDSQPRALLDLAYGLSAATLVAALARGEEAGVPGLRANHLLRLADSSYALYLIHFPLIAVLSKIAIMVLPMTLLGSCLAFILIVTSCVVAAEFFHRFVERPLLRLLSRKPFPGPARHEATPCPPKLAVTPEAL